MIPLQSQEEQSYTDHGDKVDVTQHSCAIMQLSSDTLSSSSELDGL